MTLARGAMKPTTKFTG